MTAKLVKVHDFNEPEELLSALAGHNDELWNELPEYWIFRGHADADWDLLPAALRKNSTLTHHSEKKPGPYATTFDQFEVEREQPLLFAELANRHGLPVLGGWNVARQHLSFTPSEGSAFPPHQTWDLFALTQHHGLPTRFLDWSRTATTAAYFAAHGGAHLMNQRPVPPEKKLGIWALNTLALPKIDGAEGVHLVDPPRHGNHNLTAQDGVFTLHTHTWKRDDPPRSEPLDQALGRLDATIETGWKVEMRLLTLPCKKARKLLKRLESEKVTAAKLFPGYDGVARALSETVTHSQSAWRAPVAEE